MNNILNWIIPEKLNLSNKPIFGEQSILQVLPSDVIGQILMSHVLTHKERVRFALTSRAITQAANINIDEFIQQEKQKHLDKQYKKVLNRQCAVYDAFNLRMSDTCDIDFETLQSLFLQGANVNIVDVHGRSLLHLLTMLGGYKKGFNEWVIQQVDWTLRDDQGKRAYEYLFYDQSDFSGEMIYPYIQHGLPPHLNMGDRLLLDIICNLEYWWYKKECLEYLRKLGFDI